MKMNVQISKQMTKKITPRNAAVFFLCITSIFILAAADPGCVEITKTGTGAGTVTSNPPGIDCGATCSAEFAPGTPVMLTATPKSGNTFTGWSGACEGSGNTCTISDVTGTSSVSADFALDCNSCQTYPTLCSNVEACISQCNIANHFVLECYRQGFEVSLEQCAAYYGPDHTCQESACEQHGCETCDGSDCRNISSRCSELSYCVDNCGGDSSRAQWCYETKQIGFEECEQIKPDGCTELTPTCDGCYTYPTLCSKVDTCINSCNLPSHFRQTCIDNGY